MIKERKDIHSSQTPRIQWVNLLDQDQVTHTCKEDVELISIDLKILLDVSVFWK